jgi:hypothetical protein
MEIHIIEDGQKRLLSLSRRCVNPPRPNKFYFFGSRSHRMLLVILHHSRIHFGIYSSLQEDCFSYHFFLRPKIGYRIVARLPYTSPSVQYGTIFLPLDTLWREEG